MKEYPKFGTSRIECANRKCKWQGLETDMKQVPHPKFKNATQSACPKCGNDSYYFVGGEIK